MGSMISHVTYPLVMWEFNPSISFFFCPSSSNGEDMVFFTPRLSGEKWTWILFLFAEQNGDLVSNTGEVLYFTSPLKRENIYITIFSSCHRR